MCLHIWNPHLLMFLMSMIFMFLKFPLSIIPYGANFLLPWYVFKIIKGPCYCMLMTSFLEQAS